jgi:6-phosphogluconate dehydrogenase
MQLAMIGLGRMGGNMVQRLLQGGHQVVVFDRSADAVQAHVGMGAKAARDLADLVGQLSSPRVVWVMVPAGAPVESTIDELLPALAPGDIVIDGGNSNFKDSIRRAARLRE